MLTEIVSLALLILFLSLVDGPTVTPDSADSKAVRRLAKIRTGIQKLGAAAVAGLKGKTHSINSEE